MLGKVSSSSLSRRLDVGWHFYIFNHDHFTPITTPSLLAHTLRIRCYPTISMSSRDQEIDRIIASPFSPLLLKAVKLTLRYSDRPALEKLKNKDIRQLLAGCEFRQENEILRKYRKWSWSCIRSPRSRVRWMGDGSYNVSWRIATICRPAKYLVMKKRLIILSFATTASSWADQTTSFVIDERG